MMTRFIRLALAAAATVAAAAPKAPESAASQVTRWKIEYWYGGGRSGATIWKVTLADDGRVLVEQGRKQSLTTLPPGKLAKIAGNVRRLGLSGPPVPLPGEPIPDGYDITLSVSMSGQIYAIDIHSPPASPAVSSLLSALNGLLQKGLREAKESRLDLGRFWKVTEGPGQGAHHHAEWEGVWTRRGSSNFFDGFWRNLATHEEIRDVLEVESAEHGQVSIYRAGLKQRYFGGWDPLEPGTVWGRAGWFSPGYSWQAVIER